METSTIASHFGTKPPAGGDVVAARRTHHYPELDSLRGLAALVVVFWHFDRLWDPSTVSPSVRFILEQVAIPFLNGSSSVTLFFLLSGFVLSLPYKRGTALPYPVFLSRRIARIYLPYFGALVLALLADWQLQGPMTVSPWFSQTWTAPLTPSLILQHVLLIGNYNTAQVNTAFWSLVVEMRLSILFPLLCIPLLRWRRSAALGLCACFLSLQFSVIYLLSHRLDPISYTNLSEMIDGTLAFSGGILLARWLESVQSGWGRLETWQRGLLFAVSFVFLEWSGDLKHLHLWAFTGLFTVAGGCGVLVTALCSRHASLILNQRLPAWLGRISYSLYLVHGTVLFTLVHLFLGRATRLQLLAPYLFFALLTSALFFWLIEKPSIRLSRNIGRRSPALTIPLPHSPTEA